MHPANSGTSATKAQSSSLQEMMVSYLCSVSPKMIPRNYPLHLSHLIGLRVGTVSLKVDSFFDVFTSKDVMDFS